MANSNVRPDEYRQGGDQYAGTPRDENHMSARGGYASSNYPQSGAVDDRYRQGNGERYGARHEYSGSTAYGEREYRHGGSPHTMSQRFGGYDEPRRGQSNYSGAERHAHGAGEYGPGEGDSYNRPHHGVFEFQNEDSSPNWRTQGYPNYSQQFHGGAQRGWQPGSPERGFRGYENNAEEGTRGGYNSGRQGTSGGISDYYGHSSRHGDPDYHQWRDEQIRNLDRDYEGWRQQRYQKFSDDFDSWRSTKPSTEQSHGHESSVSPDNNGSGSTASHSGKSSSSSKS